MALTNILLLSQIAGYIIAFILSLCIIVPMSMHHHEFNNHCLLFSTGTWQETDGQFIVDWAETAYCNYTIAIGVILLVLSSVQIYRLSMYAYRGVDSTFLSAFLDVLMGLVLSGMTFLGALMITLGFITWCQNMTQRFPSCDIAAGQDINKQDDIVTTGFYVEMGTAQFGAWGSFACWIGLSVFSLLKLCRYHELENMRVSMYNERQRLVFENSKDSPSPSGASTPEVGASMSEIPKYPQTG